MTLKPGRRGKRLKQLTGSPVIGAFAVLAGPSSVPRAYVGSSRPSATPAPGNLRCPPSTPVVPSGAVTRALAWSLGEVSMSSQLTRLEDTGPGGVGVL